MTNLFAKILLGIALLVAATITSKAQETEDRSAIVTFIEEQLSAPNRQIRLNGITGAFSSDVIFDSITIADEDGVWLTIVKPHLIWSRAALLRGRLQIDQLSAERIDMPRGPKPDTSAPAPEAGGITVPDLPVEVNLAKLDVPMIAFGETVFGLKSEMSIAGSLSLAGGSLTTDLDISRLDGPGGNLKLAVGYNGADKTLDLDAALKEPEDGIIANLLDLKDTPPVSLVIKGDAPIDDLKVTLAFDVAEKRILNGNLQFTGTDDGLGIVADLGGPLSTILPDDYKVLLGKGSRFVVKANLGDDGIKQIDSLTLNSGSIKLSANARLLADGFLSALNLTAQIADPSGSPVALPAQGAQTTTGQTAQTTFANANLKITYDAQNNAAFKQELQLSDLRTADISVGAVSLVVDGNLSNFDKPKERTISFKASGDVSDINAKEEALSTAIGKAIVLNSTGVWKTGAPIEFSVLDVEGRDYALRTTGALNVNVFNGQIGLEATNLSSFAALLDRDLGGSLGVVASGEIRPFSGGFDLDVNGVGNGLRAGVEALDKLLSGSTSLSGNIKRGEEGLVFDRFRVTNNQADILLDGRYSSELTDIAANADLRDIADVSGAGTGAVSLQASLKGEKMPYDAVFDLTMPRGQLSGKAIENLAASVNGKLGSDEISGILKGAGAIDGQPVSLGGTFKRDDVALTVSDFLARIGGANLALDLNRQNDSGLMEGAASIKATDVSSLAALALQDASGAIDATVNLSVKDNGQSAKVEAKANQLRVAQNRIGNADISAQIETLLKSPKVDADISASDLLVGGVAVRTVNGTVATAGNVIDFDVDAALAQENARITTRGSVTQGAQSQTIALAALDLRSNLGNANLAGPTNIVVRNGNAALSNLAINIAGGSIRLNGSAGANLNLTASIAQLPLNIANAFNPTLGLGGSISGEIAVNGAASAPRANFSISGAGITARQLAEAQIVPLDLRAQGSLNEARTISLSNLSVNNAQQISINGSGQIPLAGGGLNFSADGTAPLNIAERFLLERGSKVSGVARFNITATGPLQNPSLNGLLSVADGTFVDPLSNLRLSDIGLLAGLSGNQVTIQRLGARLASGGSISGSGTVGISGDLPANIKIALNQSKYSDGQTFTTTVSGQLAVTGGLLRDPLLSGQINLGETEITVPETFGGDIELLDVENINPDAATRATLERLAKASPTPKPSARPSILQLDLNVTAPGRIFVRGRGLDAELGGTVSLKGPTTNVRPSGQFELRRGRLTVLGQRFDLDEGTVTLTGSLDPQLRFVARTISGDTTAIITLSGRASDLQVSFTSSPELPQDEVLAAIVFGKSISSLSPTQIARLASVAFELTGGKSPGLVDGIRSGLGLDDLDVVEDSDGNAAVKAGKYISDNVYLGVEAGQNTEATINLDITDSLTARGALSSNGETSLGVFFEKDY